VDIRLSARAVALACTSALIAAAAFPAVAGAQDLDEPLVPERQAIEIASRDPNVVEAHREHPDLYGSANRDPNDGDWEISFFADDRHLVEVVVSDVTGVPEESWTGHQAGWEMARGYDAAFGRKLNAPYVWLTLCALFVAGLLDWRRPLRWAHLDLLVIVAGFGLSHYFFNRGEIGLSVPLAYAPLLYLLARMLWLGFRGSAGLRPSVPITWLAVATLVLIGFRVNLNVEDSKVIDVGYSGVIGADRIADGEPIYDNFPSPNAAGDTYGPFAYYAYVPFEQAMPWSGEWDGLPASHGAAIFFDLATIAGLFLLGRALRPDRRGSELGVVLAFAWTACPYTAYALQSNTNDSLVGALLVGALLLLSSPPLRGAMLALTTATKFAPLVLAPLFATYRANPGINASRAGGAAVSPEHEDLARRGPRGGRTRAPGGWTLGGLRANVAVAAPFALAFVVTLLVVMAQTILDPGLSTFWERTVAFQAGRASPFSIWGQEPSLEPLQTAVKVAVGALALGVAFLPRRRDPITVAALGAAVLIAVQLTVEHWFYLYLPWFLPFMFVALFARQPVVSGTGGAARAGGAARSPEHEDLARRGSRGDGTRAPTGLGRA
jgi:hypothetical protein